jgi:hypothetical protein
MALKRSRRISEKGQSIAVFAIMVPLMAIFLIGLLDYMVTNARVMEAVAISDLSAHAGAQEIVVLPDGRIKSTPAGATVATRYFNRQTLSYIHLSGIVCGAFQGRPACRIQAQVRTAGFLFPGQWVTVNAIGYLAHGVTREDQ